MFLGHALTLSLPLPLPLCLSLYLSLSPSLSPLSVCLCLCLSLSLSQFIFHFLSSTLSIYPPPFFHLCHDLSHTHLTIYHPHKQHAVRYHSNKDLFIHNTYTISITNVNQIAPNGNSDLERCVTEIPCQHRSIDRCYLQVFWEEDTIRVGGNSFSIRYHSQLHHHY